MTGIILGLFGDLWPYVVGFGALVAALVSAFFAGGSRQRAKNRYEDAEDHIETEKGVRDATFEETDADAARARLRKRLNRMRSDRK